MNAMLPKGIDQMSELVFRKKGWNTAHLEVTNLIFTKGKLYLEGMIVDTKTGIRRDTDYKALYDEEWDYVLQANDIKRIE